MGDFQNSWQELSGEKQLNLRQNCADFIATISQDKELHSKIVDDVCSGDVLSTIQKLMGDKDAKVRGNAALALGHIGGFTQSGRYLDAIAELETKNKSTFKKVNKILEGYAGEAVSA